MELLIGWHNELVFWIAETTEAENSTYKSVLYFHLSFYSWIC